MKIKCESGLCDRLRVIFSYLKKSRENKEILQTSWIKNDDCNGCFWDFFENIEDIHFNKTNDYPHRFLPHNDYNLDKIFVFQSLKTKKEIDEKINSMIQKMNKNYIAIHIRRTDRLSRPTGSLLTTDDDFHTYLSKFNDNNIFLATDNRDTQLLFKEKYKERLYFSSEIIESKELRQTSLELAIIDLFTCIKAKYFFGTNLSAFSKTIYQFRKAKKEYAL